MEEKKDRREEKKVGGERGEGDANRVEQRIERLEKIGK